jgi:hypothetical protein
LTPDGAAAIGRGWVEKYGRRDDTLYVSEA